MPHEHVPGRIEKSGVGREDDAENGLEPTAIESLRLSDEDRAPKTRLRSPRLVEVRPPDLAALDYHSEEPRLRACAERSAGSTPLASSA